MPGRSRLSAAWRGADAFPGPAVSGAGLGAVVNVPRTYILIVHCWHFPGTGGHGRDGRLPAKDLASPSDPWSCHSKVFAQAGPVSSSARESGRTAGWHFPWAPQGQRPLRWKWGVLAGTVSLNLPHTQLLIFLTQNIHARCPPPESQPGTTPGLVGWGARGTCPGRRGFPNPGEKPVSSLVCDCPPLPTPQPDI